MKGKISLAIIVSLFILSLGTSLFAQTTTVDVTITLVDSKRTSINVSYEGKSRQLELAKNLQLEIDGKKSEFTALIPGDTAQVTYDKDKQVITMIVVQREAMLPAEKLPEGWDEIDQRLIFLMVRLANVEATLDAIDQAIEGKNRLSNTKSTASKRAERENEDLDRKGGGPLKWSQFYGTTAEKFFYHPTDRNSTYHTVTVLNQQGPQADNKVGGGVPSSQGLPVHQRPPQFDYIYRSNERAKARAEAEAYELRGKIDQLVIRRQRLEAEQAGLWVEIAFRAIAHYDLDKKPLYRFEPLLVKTDTISRQHADSMRAAIEFMAVALSIIADTEREQAGTFLRIKPTISKARESLSDTCIKMAVDVTDKQSSIGRLYALAKRLDDIAANLTDSYSVSMEGDSAKDKERKETFRAQLQQSLLGYAQIILAMDEMVSQMKYEYGYQPDLDKPIQFVSSGVVTPATSRQPQIRPIAIPRAIDEINRPGSNVNPSLTKDGLEIVWQSSQAGKNEVFYSYREHHDDKFIQPRLLFNGFNPVISSDGKNIFFYDPISSSVMESKRIPNTRDFSKPAPAHGLSVRAYPTGISEDGLTLYFELHIPEIGKSDSHAHLAKRPEIVSAWQTPIPIKLASDTSEGAIKLIGASPIYGDSSSVSCVIISKMTETAEETRTPVLLKESENGTNFMLSKTLDMSFFGLGTNEKLTVFNPRLNRDLRECVFQNRTGSGVILWIVTNYEASTN